MILKAVLKLLFFCNFTTDFSKYDIVTNLHQLSDKQNHAYDEALVLCGLATLAERREIACMKFISKVHDTGYNNNNNDFI